jgi:parallel beta-helix repeat protein
MKKAVSGAILMLLLTSVLSTALIIQPVKAEGGTIYIRADGSVDPSTAPIQREGSFYSFTGNIYDEIVVQRSNIIIDGEGHTLYGMGYGSGLHLDKVTNVTITNMKIEGFYTGISIEASSNCKVYRCLLTNNQGYGIHLYFFHNQTSRRLVYSMNNSVYENMIANNTWEGILCENSLYNEIYQNIIKNNQREAGVRLVNSRFNSIYNNEIVDNGNVSWFSIGGLSLEGSSYNSIFSNNISGNFGYGIWLYPHYSENSTKNYIAENTVINNYACGISLYNSSYNVIYNNNITNDGNFGIVIENCAQNSVTNNDITYNAYGVRLNNVKDASIYGNNIVNNQIGIQLFQCEKNEIWHNNFVNNTQNANVDKASESKNYWNRVYPYGGNYWSDYAGVDEKSGPLQNQPGSDGIGDTPYFGPNGRFTDSYPLMKLCKPEIPSPYFWIIASLNIAHEKEFDIPISMRIFQGNSRTIVITMMAIYGANQSIQLDSFILPSGASGITLNMMPQQVTLYPSGFAAVTLTVTVETTTEPGHYELFCWGSPLIYLEVISSTFIFNASWEGANYPIIIYANSTIMKFNFDQSAAMICFIIEGEAGMRGYCNITIPKTLLKGDPWTLKLNGTDWPYTATQNTTHSFIYFTYTHASTFQVIIQGTWVVPEFSTIIILPTFMLTTLAITVISKKKRKSKP